MQVAELIKKQAEWSEESKNFDAAAEMYIKVRRAVLCCAATSGTSNPTW